MAAYIFSIFFLKRSAQIILRVTNFGNPGEKESLCHVLGYSAPFLCFSRTAVTVIALEQPFHNCAIACHIISSFNQGFIYMIFYTPACVVHYSSFILVYLQSYQDNLTFVLHLAKKG